MFGETRQRTPTFLLTSLLLLGPVWALQPDTRSTRWKAKYVHGSEPLKVESKGTLSSENEKLVFWRKGLAAFSTPSNQIEAVIYDNRVLNMSLEWLKGSDGWLYPFDPYSLLALPLIGAGALALLPYRQKDHFVHLIWNVDDLPHLAVLELGKKDYLEFLAEVSRVTGKPWRNLPEQRERLKRELEAAKDTSISLQLDREVSTATAELPSGRYQLILLERSDDFGELYFFRGTKVKPEKVAAVFPVSISREESSRVEPAVEFGPDVEIGRIKRVLLPGIKLEVVEDSGKTAGSLPLE